MTAEQIEQAGTNPRRRKGLVGAKQVFKPRPTPAAGKQVEEDDDDNYVFNPADFETEEEALGIATKFTEGEAYEPDREDSRRPFGRAPRNRREDSRSFGERRTFGDRDRKSFGERRSFGDRDRKPFSERRSFGDSERKPFGERRSFGDRDRKPFGERRSFDGERKSFGDRKPSFGGRKPFNRNGGGRKFGGFRRGE
jgi:hypothetical protein